MTPSSATPWPTSPTWPGSIRCCARGSDLILTPLKGAITELGDADGLQVHRSWWVAKAAVAGSVASGRNLSLRLSNGLEAPVSRASVAKLRAAGWLDS